MSLSPEGVIVVVASSYNSNGSKYHSPGCGCVDSMKSPKCVDRSVARWKDLEACQQCGGE